MDTDRLSVEGTRLGGSNHTDLHMSVSSEPDGIGDMQHPLHGLSTIFVREYDFALFRADSLVILELLRENICEPFEALARWCFESF